MLLWKSRLETSQEDIRPITTRVEPCGNVRITRRSETDQKLTVGKTTYWNVGSREVLLPIIESTPPTFAEMEAAIITVRKLQPAEGDIRVSTGGVYDRDHNLLPSFLEREAYEATEQKLIRTINDPSLSAVNLQDADFLRGKYVYLGILRRHFGHFLLESLSHIWYLLKSDPKIKVIFHRQETIEKLPPVANYIFDLIGLTKDRITTFSKTSILEQLIFPESEFELRWKARRSYADTFHELVDRSSHRFPIRSTPRNVYLTRRHLKVERLENIQKIVANERDVEALFAERGFTIIAPEKLPLSEQIAIAAGADQIAGLKGSALHLSLFCQQSVARLVQIGREQSMNQTLIDGLKNMENHQILCDFTPADRGRIIHLESVRAALREI